MSPLSQGIEAPKEILQMIGERNRALLSLNADAILTYMDKYSPAEGRRMSLYLQSNPDIFWAAVHKSRCQISTFSKKVYAESAKWLQEHGFNVPPREERI